MKKRNILICFLSVLMFMLLCININAETSAEPVIGDVNGDGYVDSKDAIHVLRYTLASDNIP